MYLLCLFVVLTALFITIVNSQRPELPLEGNSYNHFPSNITETKETSEKEKIEEAA